MDEEEMHEEKLTTENKIRIKNEITERLDKLFFADGSSPYCYIWYETLNIVLKRYYPFEGGPLEIFNLVVPEGSTISRYDEKLAIEGDAVPTIIFEDNGIQLEIDSCFGLSYVYIPRDFKEEEEM